jgi:hypothetical protein
MFSQALFLSSLWFKFSKAASLLEILNCIILCINSKNGFFIVFAVNYSVDRKWHVVSRTVHIMSIAHAWYTINSVTERCAESKFASDVPLTWMGVMILTVRQKNGSWNAAHNISFFLMKCVHYSSPSVNGDYRQIEKFTQWRAFLWLVLFITMII